MYRDPTEKELKDILETAVTQSIGYWAVTRRFDYNKGFVIVYETVDVMDAPPLGRYVITLEKMVEAATMYIEWAKHNLAGFIWEQSWDDFDSLAADCFIQYVCFKEYRYG